MTLDQLRTALRYVPDGGWRSVLLGAAGRPAFDAAFARKDW